MLTQHIHNNTLITNLLAYIVSILCQHSCYTSCTSKKKRRGGGGGAGGTGTGDVKEMERGQATKTREELAGSM